MKQKIINALYTFAQKRPQLEYSNYGDHSSYSQESRAITKIYPTPAHYFAA